MHRKIMITICCVIIGTISAAFFFCKEAETGQNGSTRGGDGAVISEKSGACWVSEIELLCGLGNVERPVGTRRELYAETENGGCMVTFVIEGSVTQQLIDGYAQSVWRACEKAAAGENQSGSGFRYREMEEAGKRQEPFDYYLWYCRMGNRKYRVGVYSTEMENGVSGGMVLKIEPAG